MNRLRVWWNESPKGKLRVNPHAELVEALVPVCS